MAGDPLKKVQAGERLNIPAEAYNAFIDAARATRGQQALGAEADAFSRQTTLAKVRNLTGVNLARFSIVGLSQPIIGPADNEAEFLRQTTFDGVTPTSSYKDRFALLLEPLAANKIGAAAVAGVVPVKVRFTGDHDHAEIKDGDPTQLQSTTSGPVHILWHQDFPEGEDPPDVTLWAVVLLGGGGGGGDSSVHFGRVTTQIEPATGWNPSEWGEGQVQELDELNNEVGSPRTIKTRFFERVIVDTPIFFIFLADQPVLLVPGCYPHAYDPPA